MKTKRKVFVIGGRLNPASKAMIKHGDYDVVGLEDGIVGKTCDMVIIDDCDPKTVPPEDAEPSG